VAEDTFVGVGMRKLVVAAVGCWVAVVARRRGRRTLPAARSSAVGAPGPGHRYHSDTVGMVGYDIQSEFEDTSAAVDTCAVGVA